jgi:hypothetical protein
MSGFSQPAGGLVTDPRLFYFISKVALVATEKTLIFQHHNPSVTFAVHMDTSRGRNGIMATAEFDC